MKIPISRLDSSKLTDQQMTDLLFGNIKDDNKSGDCIFVAGSSKAVEYRLPPAVQLYQDGRAEKILFSGGVVWDGSGLTEAQMLADKAIELGVPAQDILMENQSLHTKENVLASLLVLDRAFYLHRISRLLVVTSHYHMRRINLTLRTYMPDWIDYSLCPVNDKSTREDNWFLNPYGRQRVEAESAKLISYVKQGIIMDQELEISGMN
ncbi:YdcF family protein [Sutcliffiella horikoshii]|uniref:YdcF family protein n=1 Tax=Sutcliffiella horikoshii TaxID=79883 RepID=UPI001F27AD2C|nr:YdcF family protein [Sutcliffiella horikoshii]MCG1023298.1 YdcF family protein [Sutcliffiella horikoshii]